MNKIVDIICIVFSPTHLRRTVLIALVVGSWLAVMNLWGQFAVEGFTGGILIKVLGNFLTPFIVANAGLLANTENDHF